MEKNVNCPKKNHQQPLFHFSSDPTRTSAANKNTLPIFVYKMLREGNLYSRIILQMSLYSLYDWIWHLYSSTFASEPRRSSITGLDRYCRPFRSQKVHCILFNLIPFSLIRSKEKAFFRMRSRDICRSPVIQKVEVERCFIRVSITADIVAIVVIVVDEAATVAVLVGLQYVRAGTLRGHRIEVFARVDAQIDGRHINGCGGPRVRRDFYRHCIRFAVEQLGHKTAAAARERENVQIVTCYLDVPRPMGHGPKWRINCSTYTTLPS